MELCDCISTTRAKWGTIKELDKDLNELRSQGMDEETIKANYFLEIADNGRLPFKNCEVVDYYPAEISQAFIDPAKEGVDYTALTIATSHFENLIVLGFAFNKSWDNALPDIVELVRAFKVCKLGFETNGIGEFPLKFIRNELKQNNIDCLSASAHKFGGIRGAGFLAVNKKIKGSISPLVYGGGHENNIRSGTEPTALIVAMTVALQDAVNNMIDRRDYLFGLKQYFINKLYAVSPNIYINNNMKNVYEGILNVYFGGARGEELLEFLSEQKIYASSGSACNSNTGEPSAVLRDLGLPKERVESSIRFSMDCNNTIEEIDYVVDVIRMFYKMHGLE
jgi:hypothetical protein